MSPSPQRPDQELLQQISDGGRAQETAIEQLYTQYFQLVYEGRKKYHQLRDEDLVSAYNSSIIALRRQIVQGKFRGESTLWTYLNRIFINQCIDIIRKRTSNREETREVLPEDLAQSQQGFEQISVREDYQHLLKQLDQLGEPCKQIILDAEYWGYNSEEIAQRIGFANAKSVNSKKYTCLQKLRQMLAA